MAAKRKKTKKKIDLALIIIFILVLAMVWLFTISPFGQTKENAVWNLQMISAFLTFFLLKRARSLTIVNSGKQFIELFTSGAVLGLAISFFVAFIVQQTSFLWGLLGSISPAQIASMTIEQAFWVVLIQPLSETILLVPVILITIDIVERSGIFKGKLLGFDLRKIEKPLGLIIASGIFASLHFLAIGAGEFEFSLAGFLSFIGSPNGAYPQMLLAIAWGILIFGFNSWVPAFSAHLVNNLIAFLSGTPPSNVESFVFLIGAIVILVSAVALINNQGNVLKSFNIKGVTEIDR